MLKIISIYKDEEVEFEIEDDTDDFEQLSMELSMLIKYGYDSLRSAAEQGGAKDPDREARLYVDNIVSGKLYFKPQDPGYSSRSSCRLNVSPRGSICIHS